MPCARRKSWTKRHIIANTPASPSYANRVRLVDVNGSSTRDILWGDGNNYRYIDLQGGEQVNLLSHVDNGLGKTTDLEYSTSTAEMLAAEKLTACDPTKPDDDPWNHAWCKKMPTVALVVKRVTESDNLTIAGRPPGIYETDYTYRDPVFEGRQREFRGFSRAKSTRIGDANSPTDITESTFLLGECKDETDDSQDDCSAPYRWKDNPREALKGLPIVTERYDESGVYLSTEATEYTLRTLYHGLDGRIVAHAFESGKITGLYDTAAGTPTGAFPTTGDFVTRDFDDGTTPAVDTSRPITIRAGLYSLLASFSSVDGFGNRTSATDAGCVAGCPSGSADEAITTTTTPGRPTGDPTGWLWRTTESYVTGNAGTARNRTLTFYDDHGNPTDTYAVIAGTLALDRFHETPGAAVAGAPTGASSDTTIHVSHNTYDADSGNLTQEEGANGRCRVIGFSSDADYQQLPSVEVIAPHTTTANTPTVFGCGDADWANLLSTAAEYYDRGFGLVTQVRDMQSQRTVVQYDAFGRLSALYRPDPANDGYPSSTASVKVEYFLPPDLPGSDGRHSVIHTMTQDGDAVSDDAYLESWSYVDGFGRNIVGLSEADTSVDGHPWIASDLSEYDNKSAVRRKYLAAYYDGDPKSYPFSTASQQPYGRQRYDAFGRQLQTFDLDGTVTLQSRYHALSSDHWDAADLEPGPHQGTYATEEKDGHGRTTKTIERIHNASGALESRAVQTTYLPTGEPEVITRTNGTDSVIRWMSYDTLGRMTLNVEPDTTKNFNPSVLTDPSTMKAWRYAYDDAGDLVGTSDARGCGVNYSYDAAGRLIAEDYSPCLGSQATYSAANIATGSGVEVAYLYDQSPAVMLGPFAPPGFPTNPPTDYFQGRLVMVADRASLTVNNFDGRGRVTNSAVLVTAPGAETVDYNAGRYVGPWHERAFAFDGADREIAATTGATAAELQGASVSRGGLVDKTNLVTTTYTARGTLDHAGGSYQRDGTHPNVGSIARSADGLVQEVHYGDIADTATHYSYDNRRRLRSVQTYRGPPGDWTSGTGSTTGYTPHEDPNGTPDTFQLLLQDTDYTYDVVNNPTEIHDWRNPAEWPAGAKPVTQQVQYDDLYRATRIDYRYSAGDDTWTDPFDQEDTSGVNDTRRAAPSPHVTFDKRVQYQAYSYDWLGNTTATDDDAGGFYDRSLGDVTNDTANDKPYQLRSAANSQKGSTDRSGNLEARYDDAGNMTRLKVTRNGPCTATSACTQLFAYGWDEVGRLVQARRWDGTSAGVDDANLPSATPAAHLKYLYDAGDDRVIKEAVDDANAQSRYTLYLFETLELRGASWISANSEYDDSAATEVAYLSAHGVSLGRLWYEPDSNVPTNSQGRLHVFYELGDHLGSTSVVLDQATSELVERTTFEGYGATESDYRPTRWNSFREDRRFTGKEEDVEVGLYYFGKRYLNPLLGRWVSADPLAVHGLGADPNVYAYVEGQILQNVDPLGLDSGSGGTSGQDLNNNGNGGSQGTSGDGKPPPSPSSRIGFDPNSIAQVRAAGAMMGASAAALPVGGELEMRVAMADLREKLSPRMYDEWLKGAAVGAEATAEGAVKTAGTATAGGAATCAETGGGGCAVAVAVDIGAVAVVANAQVIVGMALGDLGHGTGPKADENRVAGKRREDQVQKELEEQHPNASVQREQYLRDKNGKIVKDPVTGKARRIDHVVIEHGKAEPVETTSMTASKEGQLAREQRVRGAGGKYVRDRRNRKMVPVTGISRVERRP